MLHSRSNVSLFAAGLFGAALALASTQALSACKTNQNPSTKSAPETKEAKEEGEEEEGDEEEAVDVAKLPEPVRAAATKQFGKLDGCKASSESEHGAKIYEIVGKGGDGLELTLTVTSSGTVMEVERETKADALPGEVRATLAKSYGDATVKKAELVEERFYEMHLTRGDKRLEVKVTATGHVMEGKE